MPLEQLNGVSDAQCFSEIPLKTFYHRSAVAAETAGAQSCDYERFFLRSECAPCR